LTKNILAAGRDVVEMNLKEFEQCLIYCKNDGGPRWMVLPLDCGEKLLRTVKAAIVQADHHGGPDGELLEALEALGDLLKDDEI